MGEEHTTLTSTDGEPTSGYWYTRGAREIEPVDVLNLLRRYREAERRMRARTRDRCRSSAPARR